MKCLDYRWKHPDVCRTCNIRPVSGKVIAHDDMGEVKRIIIKIRR